MKFLKQLLYTTPTHYRIHFFSLQVFKQRSSPLSGEVDRMKDAANQLQEMDVVLSHVNVSKIEELTNRLAI